MTPLNNLITKKVTKNQRNSSPTEASSFHLIQQVKLQTKQSHFKNEIRWKPLNMDSLEAAEEIIDKIDEEISGKEAP